jgi:predicted PurR-regulated permease PerM
MFSRNGIFWTLVFGLSFLFLYKVSDILFPFVVSIMLAYFLDPVTTGLEKKQKLSRVWATVITFFTFVIMVVVVSTYLLPLLFDQIAAFASQIPKYKLLVQDKLIPYIVEYVSKLEPGVAARLKDGFNDASNEIFAYTIKFMKAVFKSGVAFMNVASLIFITPIITFYLLRDWKYAVKTMDGWVPKGSKKTVHRLAEKIDQTLSGYLRGQTNVCLFLALFYSIGFAIVGLNYALFVGVMTGILAFIPYVGFAIGAIIGILIAYFQFADTSSLFMVVGIFLLGQIIEGNFITPKLVGEKVGLHPIWIFFALLSGGALFGFVGVLFAIPVAAVIGIITRFLLEVYMSSYYYKS